MGDGLLFTVDDVYDRQRASDGHSRYGAYLALGMVDPKYFGPAMLDDPLLWATFAWEIASPPAMSSGYVTWADPIENAFVFPGADGEFMAEVLVRTGPPVALPGWRSWERTTAWGLVEPHYDLRTALTRVTLTVVLDAEPLAPPDGATDHAELVRAAKASVQSSAAAMEATVGECIRCLSEGEVRRP
jgi:hypothetical protein